MKLTWYGHASFLIESNAGIRIVTDPYNPQVAGFKDFPDAADIVIMSSDNDRFHCNEQLVPKREGAEVINALTVAQKGGSYESHGISFKAIEAMEHLQHHEHNPDQNGMYRFNVDGIEIGHMGDVGNSFSEAQIEFFKDVDVLLALAGGYPTVELSELKRIITQAKPKYVVPMHFRTLAYKPRNTFFIHEFLSYFADEDVDFAFVNHVTLDRAAIPASTRVLVLDHH